MGKIPQFSNVYLVSGLATIGGLIQGFDVSSMSGIIGTDQYKTYFNKPDSVAQGGITASMAGGSLLGALFSSWTSDRYGRRDSMVIACILWLIGSILMCAVQNTAMLIASRIINGFSVGILTSQGPILIAEISLPHQRGRLLSLQQWMITWGILIMYFISYGSTFLKTTAVFRLPWGLQMIPAIILLSVLPMMPRSPRWLATQDRWEEATEIIARLHAKGDTLDPLVVAQVTEIREKLELERQYQSTSWSEVFNSRNIVRVHCGIFTHVWSQFSGTNAMMYYIVYIFQMAGLSGNNALLSATIQYIINVVMTLPALLFIDRLPRRRLFIAGAIGMSILQFTQGGLMKTYGEAVPGGLKGSPTVTWMVNNGRASKAIIACSYLFIAVYAPTWGPLGWAYPPEIIPLYIRSKSVSLATCFNWVCNFALTFFSPPGFQHIQWKMYCVFGSTCMAAAVHVFLFFPETCGKSLEEIDDVFNNQSIWAFKAKSEPSRFITDIEQAKEQLNAGKVGVTTVKESKE
ncbi:Major facilitator superfamily domain general substrate transporter [Penicillium paradoxum]|uniref:Major facilitator superfamily domain general substrate transporter n=1 Tax=Penicillium paradoxum TaxID=176176 RepID=UPI0025485DF2|nr:Major facilitator superfamily domain general substrate transporter [Penicillium paradoxum]KAJ5773053.1 Major facilitator superfamily domain general substrate transporter [Penicillium paradoxum]